MEEDIEVVEDLICNLKQSDEKEDYKQAIALENLLKEYKSLKERYQRWKDYAHEWERLMLEEE